MLFILQKKKLPSFKKKDSQQSHEEFFDQCLLELFLLFSHKDPPEIWWHSLPILETPYKRQYNT